MKYKAVIEVMPKPNINDVFGQDLFDRLQATRFPDLIGVRMGTVIEIEFEAEREHAAALIEAVCQNLLVHPVAQTYGFRLQFTGQQGWGETPMRYMVEQDEVKSVDLKGKFPAFGGYEILRAEWKAKDPSFAVLYYTKDGEEQKYGLRINLDAQDILDDFEQPACEADQQIKAAAEKIWTEIMIGMGQTLFDI